MDTARRYGLVVMDTARKYGFERLCWWFRLDKEDMD